jgi:hypothetical protein
MVANEKDKRQLAVVSSEAPPGLLGVLQRQDKYRLPFLSSQLKSRELLRHGQSL